jgi:hypothetical protein
MLYIVPPAAGVVGALVKMDDSVVLPEESDNHILHYRMIDG